MPRATHVGDQNALPADQRLPQKELAVFRGLYKLYEHKQYKKLLKQSEGILKKFPKHSETLSLRGLTLSCVDRLDEAKAACRLAIRYFPLNYVVWHLYGLVLRGANDYLNAITCFQYSLKIEPENSSMTRDLAWMYMQVRDYSGFVACMDSLTEKYPDQSGHWLAKAVGHHLAGDLDLAASILSAYLDAQKKDGGDEARVTEVFLYLIQVLEEAGKYAEALDKVNSAFGEKGCTDQLERRERRAELLMRVGKWSEAAEAYRDLMTQYSSDNYVYHKGLLSAMLEDLKIFDLPASHAFKQEPPAEFFSRVNMGTDATVRAKIEKAFAELRVQFPRSPVVTIMSLFVLEAGSADFNSLLDRHCRSKLRKGVPSLFSELKLLYTSTAKRDAIRELFLGYAKDLEATGKFAGSASSETSEPTLILWTWFVLAQHYDAVGDADTSLAFMDRCLDHTPTVVEIRQARGKVLKHAGDMAAAVEEVDEAREMDLQDRYVNIFACKYMLADGQHERAVKTAGQFTKVNIDPEKNLDEMQAFWFSLGASRGHWNHARYGKGLKKLLSIESHAADLVQDQFEFHYYCIFRKQTLRSYVGMIRFGDDLPASFAFRQTYAMIVENYFSIHDTPSLASFKTEDELREEEDAAKMATMDSAAFKKYLRQKKKDDVAREAQKQKEKEEQQATLQKAATSGGSLNKPVGRELLQDVDPEGLIPLRTKDSTPLDEARKRVQKLLVAAPRWTRTHELAAEVALRRNLPLVALRSIRKLRTLAGEHDPSVPTLAARCAFSVRKNAEVVTDATVKAVVDDELKAVLGDVNCDLRKFLEGWLAANPARSTSISTRGAVASALAAVGEGEAAKAVFKISESDLTRGHHHLNDVIKVHKSMIKAFGDSDPAVKGLYEFGHKNFARSTYFGAATSAKKKEAAPAESE